MQLKKILLIDSAYPINVRNKKILNSIAKEPSLETRYCAWNRTAKEIEAGDFGQFIFSKTSGYGQKLKKLFNMVHYAKFVGKQIKQYQPDVIIASHWDSLLIASLYKQKRQTLIYEILDIPTSLNRLVRAVLRLLEIWALQKTDKLIFASRFFTPIYQSFKGETALIENKPYKIPLLEQDGNAPVSNRLVVTFLGTVRYLDILKNLVEAAKKANVEVEIWGDGPDEKQLREYAKEDAQIRFYGRYNYDMIGKIYEKSDLIWAVYPSNDHNVKYAISNKYHECILYGKPGVFADKTQLGNMVKEKKMGFVVNPYSVNDMVNLFHELSQNKQALEQYKQNLRQSPEPRFWEEIEKKLVEIIVNN